MATANNNDKDVILKQGYVKLKSHGVFTKWKKKWAVLQDSAISSERKIILYKKDKGNKNDMQTILLTDINSLEMIDTSKSPFGFKLTLKDEKTEILAFAFEPESREWYDHVQKLCFGESEEKESKDQEAEKETENTEVDLKDDETTSQRDCFEVSIQPSAKLHISGECSLQITPIYVELHDIKDPEMFYASWPISSMRRFGFDHSKFMFEAGRHCDTGEGIFTFRTKEGEQIHRIVQNYAEQLAIQTRKFSAADDNENDEFELRPLPPIPPD